MFITMIQLIGLAISIIGSFLGVVWLLYLACPHTFQLISKKSIQNKKHIKETQDDKKERRCAIIITLSILIIGIILLRLECEKFMSLLTKL